MWMAVLACKQTKCLTLGILMASCPGHTGCLLQYTPAETLLMALATHLPQALLTHR